MERFGAVVHYRLYHIGFGKANVWWWNAEGFKRTKNVAQEIDSLRLLVELVRDTLNALASTSIVDSL
eukprot:3166226-Amphidinium_carterae.2